MPFAVRSAFLSAGLLFLILCPMWAGSGTTITVMTQNMDAGTDLGFALAYLNTSTPAVGIDLTYREIMKVDFAGRAAILAKQIAEAKPDLVSLQEVTTWVTNPGQSSQMIICDQLQLLLGALGGKYSVAAANGEIAVNNLTAMSMPMSNGVVLAFRDSDVVLVRAGVSVTGVVKKTFDAKLSIPTPTGAVAAPQGWITVHASLGGNAFTLVDTHLQTTLPGQPGTFLLQTAQVEQLAAALAGEARVVVAGDFNSNAAHTPPEKTAAVGVMLSAGFTDTWPAANRGNPGYTWPLEVEDPGAPHPNGPFERIDFIFERGFGIQSVDRIGWKGPHASDHAGVVATLVF